MKWYEWTSLLDETRRFLRKTGEEKRLSQITADEYYQMIFRKDSSLHTLPITCINQSLSERGWYAEGKPYFRVWPEMIEVLTLTDINAISAEHLVLPYKEFTINFPEDNDLIVDENHKIQSLMVTEANEIISPVTGKVETGRQIILWINFNERDKSGELILTYRKANIRSGVPLEEAFSELPMDPNYRSGIQVPESLMAGMLRLAVGVALLATSASKVVEPDVLAKHLEAYRVASEARRKELVAKAHRAGKIGWKVHNPDIPRQLVGCLSAAVQDSYEARSSGRPLKYSHVRRAHWHLVRYGEKHSLVKPMLFAETTVRKDLPRKEQ